MFEVDEVKGTFQPRGVARSEIEIEIGSGMEIGMEVRTGEIDVGNVTEATTTAATRPPILAATLTLAEPETL